MKEFEAENFEMERNNITNTSEFVLEQMRIKFGERAQRADEQLQKAVGERDKLENEGRQLLEQLRGFNSAADHRITDILSRIREE